MRILVTGMSGFVAPHLLRELRGAGHTVHGTALGETAHPGVEGGVVHGAELRSADAVARVVNHVQPDAVIHLGAQSNPARSWDASQETFDINVQGTINLVAACARLAKPAKLVLVSSSDVYGVPSAEADALNEGSPVQPSTPYGVSKLAAEHCARVYGERLGTVVLVARPFSHTGPGQTTSYVVPAFAHQIARIEAGLADSLSHGNLDAYRDFTDVRDVVRAYRLLVESSLSGGTYNVCSGRAVRVAELLEMLRAHSTVAAATKPEAERLRPERCYRFRGDASLLRRRLGWEPRIPLEQTLLDVLNHERARIAESQSAAR